MWLTLQVRAEDASKVALGQKVKFAAAGIEDEAVGSVSWVSTTADSRTRMVSVRADLPNPEERLRSETFGTGQIVLRDEPNAVVVQKEAIHSDGCCQLVFVRDKGYFASAESPKVFHVRTVRLGAQSDGDVEVLAGVVPGEVVVTEGSDVLRSQLLKNNLGEGCTCGQ
jgi:multidrug efflux pump subunit AcrA (membrane-fusion protein)